MYIYKKEIILIFLIFSYILYDGWDLVNIIHIFIFTLRVLFQYIYGISPIYIWNKRVL